MREGQVKGVAAHTLELSHPRDKDRQHSPNHCDNPFVLSFHTHSITVTCTTKPYCYRNRPARFARHHHIDAFSPPPNPDPSTSQSGAAPTPARPFRSPPPCGLGAIPRDSAGQTPTHLVPVARDLQFSCSQPRSILAPLPLSLSLFRFEQLSILPAVIRDL